MLLIEFRLTNGLTLDILAKVFRISAKASNVDIRYDMKGTTRKKVMLAGRGKQAIQIGYKTECSIPTINCTTGSGNNLGTKC